MVVVLGTAVVVSFTALSNQSILNSQFFKLNFYFEFLRLPIGRGSIGTDPDWTATKMTTTMTSSAFVFILKKELSSDELVWLCVTHWIEIEPIGLYLLSKRRSAIISFSLCHWIYNRINRDNPFLFEWFIFLDCFSNCLDGFGCRWMDIVGENEMPFTNGYPIGFPTITTEKRRQKRPLPLRRKLRRIILNGDRCRQISCVALHD